MKGNAVLLAVATGKYSEGNIYCFFFLSTTLGYNFKNEYCRCVVCIGIPYPNLYSSKFIFLIPINYFSTRMISKQVYINSSEKYNKYIK